MTSFKRSLKIIDVGFWELQFWSRSLDRYLVCFIKHISCQVGSFPLSESWVYSIHKHTHTHFEKHSLPSTQLANTCIVVSEKRSIASQKECMTYFFQIFSITWSSRNSFLKHLKTAVYVKKIYSAFNTHVLFKGCRITYKSTLWFQTVGFL